MDTSLAFFSGKAAPGHSENVYRLRREALTELSEMARWCGPKSCSPSGDPLMSLNQAQRTALATTLLQLEQALNEIEQLFIAPVAGATYTIQWDLQPVTVQQIRGRCSEMRHEIAEMMAFFELPRHVWHSSRIIYAEMSTAWINLEEMRPHKLRRYGAVDPALNETLAPRLEQLIQQIRAIQDLASRGT